MSIEVCHVWTTPSSPLNPNREAESDPLRGPTGKVQQMEGMQEQMMADIDLKEDEVNYPVQFNGKVKFQLKVDAALGPKQVDEFKK